ADDVGLVHLRQGSRRGPTLRRRQPIQGVVRRVRDLVTAAARPRALEERWLEPLAGDAHRAAPTDAPAAAPTAVPAPAVASSAARASAKRAISLRVVTSVAQTSRPSARLGSPGSSSARGMPARTPRASGRRWIATASGT